MKYIVLIFSCLSWFAFAYDIEYDRDFMTWIWLITSILLYVLAYLIHSKEQKQKQKHGKETN